MPLLTRILIHGLIYASVLTAFLLVIMRILLLRVWAMSDYPKSITERVPPQTKEEKKKGALILIPFLIIGLGFPIISTLMLEAEMGGQIDLLTAFLNIFGILMIGNAADLLILNILIVGTITPKFVIIPGTEDLKNSEYKAFRKYHAKGHVWSTLFMAVLSFLIALLIVIF